MRGLVIAVASFGGLGYAPVASGTFGTLGAIPLAWAFSTLSTSDFLVATLVLFLVAWWSAERSGPYFGVVDSGKIVIDEVIGYVITMALIPWSWTAAVLGFFWFRLFDIWKPWPVRTLERRNHNGFGVVIDDCFAGVYAHIALRITLALFVTEAAP